MQNKKPWLYLAAVAVVLLALKYSDTLFGGIRLFFSLLVPLGLVQVFGVGKPFLGYLERLASHDWVLRLTSALRTRLYRSLEREGVFWVATRKAGEVLDFGGLLGYGPIMPLNTRSPEVFINRGGRLPAPMQALKN